MGIEQNMLSLFLPHAVLVLYNRTNIPHSIRIIKPMMSQTITFTVRGNLYRIVVMISRRNPCKQTCSLATGATIEFRCIGVISIIARLVTSENKWGRSNRCHFARLNHRKKTSDQYEFHTHYFISLRDSLSDLL